MRPAFTQTARHEPLVSRTMTAEGRSSPSTSGHDASGHHPSGHHPSGHDAVPVSAMGDAAVLVLTQGADTSRQLAEAVLEAVHLRSAPGRPVDVVVGFGGTLVVLDLEDPDPEEPRADLATWAAWLTELVPRTIESSGDAGYDRDSTPSRVHNVPVVFDGDDLDEVASILTTTSDAIIELLVTADLEVALLGFAPGFAYLTGLPASLAGLERRAAPRAAVPPGSVAVAGGFAGIYPNASPGGWHLLGRTTFPLFDPSTPPYSPFVAGDRVRFTVARPDTYQATIPVSTRHSTSRHGQSWLEVIQPGIHSTVQDAGRRGVAHLGVPSAGTADPTLRILANRLLGSSDDAAVLECTGVGPTLRVHADGVTPTYLAVLGASPGAVSPTIDGRSVPAGAVLPLHDGQVLAVGPIQAGLRATVGVGGGFATPEALGSRASDVLAGLGPGPIEAGDHLAIGTPTRPRGHLDAPRLTGALAGPGNDACEITTLRVIPGPHHLTTQHLAALLEGVWAVTVDSNRIGLRLDRPGGTLLEGVATVTSTPMVTGAVQIPPDGRPIILLPDHGTLGGYLVAACVISADLPVLGRLRPGSEVAFVACSLTEAEAAWRTYTRDLDARVTGWHPTRAAH